MRSVIGVIDDEAIQGSLGSKDISILRIVYGHTHDLPYPCGEI